MKNGLLNKIKLQLERVVKKRLTLLIIVVASLFTLPLEGKEVNDGEVLPVLLNGVPTDLSLLFYFNSVTTVKESKLLLREEFSSFLDTFLKQLSPPGKEYKSDALLSLHYVGINELSPLLIVERSGLSFSAVEELLKPLSTYYRTYNGVKIYRRGTVEWAVTDSLLLLSSSIPLIESSLRTLQYGEGVVHEPLFRELFYNREKGEGVLFVNHSQLGKFFSTYIDRPYLGYANFFSSLANWSALSFQLDGEVISGNGEFLLEEGDEMAHYLSLFVKEQGEESKASSFASKKSLALLSFTSKEFEQLFLNYREYRARRGSPVLGPKKGALEWFISLEPKEVALAISPIEGELEGVVIIRSRGGNNCYSVEQFVENNFFERGFGQLFALSNKEALYRRGEWTLIGSSKTIEHFLRERVESSSTTGKRGAKGGTKGGERVGKGRERGRAPLTVELKSSFSSPFIRRYFNRSSREAIERVGMDHFTLDLTIKEGSENSGRIEYKLILHPEGDQEKRKR